MMMGGAQQIDYTFYHFKSSNPKLKRVVISIAVGENPSERKAREDLAQMVSKHRDWILESSVCPSAERLKQKMVKFKY